MPDSTQTDTDNLLPVWQSALLAHGCRVNIGSDKIISVELKPAGDCLLCAPSASGSMLPFNVEVIVGQTVTITWDSEVSRYIVAAIGEKIAA